MSSRISHVIGFDDAPFDREHRGDVLVVGAVYSGLKLEGVLSGKVRRDGANATRVLAQLVSGSRFGSHVQALLLQGIALAGFNVIDLHRLHEQLGIPVIAVARHPPNLQAIHSALIQHVPGGAQKWRMIERAGLMEHVSGLYVQRAGLSLSDTKLLLEKLAVNSTIPEPLRTAHLIAGGITLGESTGRV